MRAWQGDISENLFWKILFLSDFEQKMSSGGVETDCYMSSRTIWANLSEKVDF